MNKFTILAALLVLLTALYLLMIGWDRSPATRGTSAREPASPMAPAAVGGNDDPERVPAPESSASGVTTIRVLDAETAVPVSTATGCRAPRGTRLRIVTSEDLRADEAGLMSLGDIVSGTLLVGAPGYASRNVAIARGRSVEVRLHRLRSAAIHCVDESGSPIEGIFVAVSAEPIVGRPVSATPDELLSGEPGSRSISCARSGADGIAHVDIADAGDYWLRPWSEHMGCTDPSIFEQQKALHPDDPCTLTFREFQAVAVYSDESPVRSCELNFPAGSRSRIDRDARHMLFEREFVVQAAERRLRGRWPSVVVHAFVAGAGDTGVPVEVSGLLEDGRTFVVTATSMPVARLAPTSITCDSAVAVARLIVHADVAAPNGFDVVRKHSRLRLRAAAAQTVLAPAGEYVVSFAGEWVGGRPVGKAVQIADASMGQVTLSAGRHRPVLVTIQTPDVPNVGRMQLLWRLHEGGDKRSFNWNPRTDRLAWLPIGRHRLEVFCPGYETAAVDFEVADGLTPIELVIDMRTE